MPLKTPDFWYQPAGFYSLILQPVSWLYAFGYKFSRLLPKDTYKASIPVLCLGNAVMGGSGKTPAALAVMRLIKHNDLYKKPVFLTRGYGGSETVARFVNLDKDTSDQTGDEALLLARIAPTIIAQNRTKGAQLAEAYGADLIIMDDGLQNRSLHKDISLLVIDRSVDFGNGRLFPSGPIREPLSSLLPRVHCVLCIGPSLISDKPVFTASVHTSGEIKPKPCIAFAGIGRPQKFFNSLQQEGFTVIRSKSFPDHYRYTKEEILALNEEAQKHNAVLYTTEKDYVRIPADLRSFVHYLPIRVKFEQEDALCDFIKHSLS